MRFVFASLVLLVISCTSKNEDTSGSKTTVEERKIKSASLYCCNCSFVHDIDSTLGTDWSELKDTISPSFYLPIYDCLIGYITEKSCQTLVMENNKFFQLNRLMRTYEKSSPWSMNRTNILLVIEYQNEQKDRLAFGNKTFLVKNDSIRYIYDYPVWDSVMLLFEVKELSCDSAIYYDNSDEK